MIYLLKIVLFLVVVTVIGTWLSGRKWLEGKEGEIERNDKFEPPSDRQLRWDIRHIREDLHMLVLINYALLFLALFLTFFVFWEKLLG